MRTTLLRMLTTLTCVLAACADIMPVPDFSLEKIAGKWYMAGFATNAQWFVTKKDTMKMIWNNDNDMRFVDVVYDDYAVVHTIKTKEGVSEVLNKLYRLSSKWHLLPPNRITGSVTKLHLRLRM
ncbi:hypothetical protein GOODEAATRI_012897 [Goodea atripinnis]|uniref:Lipocalin/cytosolic fatty-acid binding domain-containing protein n=1 Tax=Goodea atripinnis TaxID=208336 RepID=A0ABV0P3N9_9TELE